MRNELCWFIYCVNDNDDVDLKAPQIMHCIFCYNSPILISNPKTHARKGLIMYNTTNGITTLKKHVNTNHFVIEILFEEEISSPLKVNEEIQPTKKK
jgi:hypothetical protein